MRDQISVALLSLAVVLGAAACGSDDESSTVTQNATAPPTAAPPAATPAAPATAPPVSGAPRVLGLDLGRSLNPDNTMYDATVLFLATNEVWATMVVEGTAPKATLQARWVTAAGDVVATQTQEIALKGRTVVGFHAPPPSGGWKLGRYRVEILLNDVAAASKDFEVKEPPL